MLCGYDADDKNINLFRFYNEPLKKDVKSGDGIRMQRRQKVTITKTLIEIISKRFQNNI